MKNKYTTLWICVIISAVIILAAWLFAVRYNFERINKELGDENQQAVEAFTEVEEAYDIGDILKEGEEKFNELKETFEE